MHRTEQEKEDALNRRDVSQLTNMINEGVDVNSLVVPKHTDILLVAFNKQHRSLFKVVLSKGFNCHNDNGFLYVHHAIRTQSVFFVKKIIEHYEFINLNYNEYTKDRDNCLHVAAMEQNIGEDIFIYLTQCGIKWTERNKLNQTPLHILLRNHFAINEAIVNLLRNQTKAFFIKDDFGISPLDIINSASLSEEWRNNNKLIINLAGKIQQND